MAQAEEIRTETGPLDYDYTEKEKLCQENLQNHKACSPDKIKNEMLKFIFLLFHSYLGVVTVPFFPRIRGVVGLGDSAFVIEGPPAT
eukprot:g58253.t1